MVSYFYIQNYNASSVKLYIEFVKKDLKLNNIEGGPSCFTSLLIMFNLAKLPSMMHIKALYLQTSSTLGS